MAHRFYSNKKDKGIKIYRYTRARCATRYGSRRRESETMEIEESIEHYRDVRTVCTGCMKPVHLARRADGTYEWQHDHTISPRQVDMHRRRGVGRQKVPRAIAERLIEEARS